ncbi:MAG: hypothetical protein VB029_09850 [Anaerolineaceae bacterium]|nr:hypothetical protein [Petrimonas sp.]MEA4959998.1 hypothetical protein [Anaerolineaceae bacterium]
MKGDQYFYDETVGEVYTDDSQNFDIKIEKWEYYYDKASSRDRILLSLTVKNKSRQELDDFVAKISLNPDAADLVASGILIYDQFEPCDLIPKKTVNGASYAIEFLVESDSWLTEIHADKTSLLDQIRSITLEFTWSGGKETIELQLDPLTEP